MGINRVAISGNLTRDPELRQTSGGMAVLGFCVAVNDRRKNPQTGEWEDFPNYVDCTMFGKRAEAVSHYLAKGSKVAVDGKLRYSVWERDGQKRSKLEVIADEIELMSRQSAAGAEHVGMTQTYTGQGGTAPQSAPQRGSGHVYGGEPSLYDQDIPF